MPSITKVLFATATLSGFSMAAPYHVHVAEWASGNKPALEARGDWPAQQYTTTQLTTTTPASCFSTSSKTSCPSSKAVVKCSTSTPWVESARTQCFTKTLCSETTEMVRGTPTVIKMTSYIQPECTISSMPIPMPPKPKLTTSCVTKYSTLSGSTWSTSTKTFVSVITPPAKSQPTSKFTTSCSSGESTTKTIISPIWTPSASKSPATLISSSSSCKKTSSNLVWFPESATPAKAVASTASQSSAMATSSYAESAKATSSKASNATSSWSMPTHPISTMESSASPFAGASIMILSALAAVALAMTAL